MASVDASRTRRTFARLEKSIDIPNLIDIQKKSFAWLVDMDGGGLRETIDDISPMFGQVRCCHLPASYRCRPAP